MGKNRHSKDRLYIVQTEYARDWGGFKEQSRDRPLRMLAFDCCALSLKPFEHPVCAPDGTVFDMENILPYLKKYKRNPVDGAPLAAKDLTTLHFHKNEAGEYQCPVTYKTFNGHTHIVANIRSGHVYAMDGIEVLCRRPKYWFDPMTSEPFTGKDLVDLQNPHDVSRRRVEQFDYVVQKIDPTTIPKGEGVAPEGTATKVRASALMQKVMDRSAEADEERKRTREAIEAEKDPEEEGTRKRHRARTTGRDCAALTSTVAVSAGTSVEYRELSEKEVTQMIYDRVKKDKARGFVALVTSLGVLNLELYADRCPKTCDSFLQHCQAGYYNESVFFRIVKHFVVQGGDPTNTGTGGQSAFGRPFQDELHPHLRHDARGVLSMANAGRKHDNRSQFFLTFQPQEHLDDKHTVFGRLAGGGKTLDKIEALPNDKKDRPLEPPAIRETKVFKNPFKEAEAALKAEGLL